MEKLGGSLTDRIFAMAGRSPWGANAGPEAGPGAPAGDVDTPAGEAPAPPGGEGAPRKPRNPWVPEGSEPPPRRAANIEDIFRPRPRGPDGGSGGPGGRFPKVPTSLGGRNWFPLIVAGIVAIWLFATSVHQIGPKQQGIVTTFGRYERTLDPGVALTLPWPFQNVRVEDVTSIRRDTIPEGEAEKLMLTGDQNLVDLSYLIRWNIDDLKLYTFQLADPAETVREVGEAAMRASIAEVTLDEALSGAGRAQIEQNVRTRMQNLLDAYRSGVAVQGVEIKKADPPERVVDAFKEVLAAQQDAQSDINRARAWAEQVTARAEGEAAAFDKVYAEYRLAPEVTRRRMYYETMERVLRQTDKTIVETDGVIPYLPLSEAGRRPAPPAAAPPTQEEGR